LALKNNLFTSTSETQNLQVSPEFFWKFREVHFRGFPIQAQKIICFYTTTFLQIARLNNGRIGEKLLSKTTIFLYLNRKIL
jgi:hypothetical protein